MPFITVNGRTLHYADTKPAESGTATPSTTIIFVHGLGSTQNYFFPILPYLTAYRCITFDNYGAGRSKYRHGEHQEEEEELQQSIEAIGRDVIGVLDHLRVRRAVVVGYSMGGMLPTYLASTTAAAAAAERVIAGVCIGPVHPSESVAEVFRKRVPAVREGGMEAMADTIPNAATGSKSTSLQRAFIREMLMAQDPEGYIANCRAIEHASPPSYKNVHVPILVIAGDEDKSAPLKGCEFILDQVASPEKRLEVLKGVGHWHCVEASDEVGRLVKDFVDGLAK